MTSVVKLVWIIAASVRTEGTSEVIQGNSCSKQDQHWSRSRVFRALFSQVSKPLRMEDPPRFWVPAAMFILWVKNVFLVSRPNHFYSTISHPPAMQHCEEPGSAGFVFLLTPPGYPYGWGKGRSCFPPATGCASVGTDLLTVVFPRCLAFNLPNTRSSAKLGLVFLSLTSSSLCLLYHGKFILGSQGYYWSSRHTKPRFR